MDVLEWPGDVYQAMVEVLNGTDPITLDKAHEDSMGALMALAAGNPDG